MTLTHALYLSIFIPFISIPTIVNGHGYMESPRSRNWRASVEEDGSNMVGLAGIPKAEYCYHCLNTKAADDVCGVGQTGKYDDWVDTNGNPMPWKSEGVFQEGQEITVKSVLTTNHAGHMDLFLCPDGDDSTQECFEKNPATFVKDNLYGGPQDGNYPSRGYFANDQYRFEFVYRLPAGVVGDKVMMQWRYVTANSCIPKGYLDPSLGLADLGWLRSPGMVECADPLDPTGARNTGDPEQFWNCAELTIMPSDTPITNAPTQANNPTPVPTPTVPVPSPTTPSPTPGSPGTYYCNWQNCDGVIQGGPWCNESKERCVTGCGGGTWCDNGSIPDTPSPTTAPPTTSPTPSPTPLPTTKAPTTPAPTLPPDTPSPTPAPTTLSPLPAPTPSPTPGGGEICCTQDYQTCLTGWCGENESQCSQCSGHWSTLSPGCISKWGGCKQNPTNCCPNTTCQVQNPWYSQCL